MNAASANIYCSYRKKERMGTADIDGPCNRLPKWPPAEFAVALPIKQRHETLLH